jgi:hypothetical protein
MNAGEHIVVVPPKKCPACGEELNGFFGPAYLHLIEDEQMPCKWVLVKGWYCDELFGERRGMVFGTAVGRGPVADDGETEPVDINEPDLVYIVDYLPDSFHPRRPFGGRAYRNLGPA